MKMVTMHLSNCCIQFYRGQCSPSAAHLGFYRGQCSPSAAASNCTAVSVLPLLLTLDCRPNDP
jgi:hypothetical protein